MNKLVLTSPLPPSVNSYLNYKVGSSGRRKFVQAYPSEETVVYEQFFTDYVKDEIRNQKWQRPEKGKLVFLKMTFFLDRKRKDPSNFLKVPLDVLTKAGVYVDDDTALPLIERVYIDKNNPRIEIEIYESPSIGIFDDEEDLNSFFDANCSNCKKNVETCGVLKKLLDNRIIEEVDGRTCLKKKEKDS
ncbi:RusA family crossover junction endodeoxyribonuclease [Priestia aryabhattai]|uniref:RusA family crossover junction endodeoxyribonuclease n=1 Tax=Priestia aryabhattai TaxID=412384 RepID=UPI002E249B6D|nr:RusA family crossover junction endodeoxyribonuclease [Priestia aryabhattai]MED4262034.1 RusA family crossover junction endodeoxyribonuclease [Priestia aryabhattai]